MKVFLLIISLSVIVTFLFPLASSTTVQLDFNSVLFDGFIRNSSETYTRDGVNNHLFIGVNTTSLDRFRSVIEFNISSVPANAILHDVNLTFYVNQTSVPNDRIYITQVENRSTVYADTNDGNKLFTEDLGNGSVYTIVNVTVGFTVVNVALSINDLYNSLSTGWFAYGLAALEADNGSGLAPTEPTLIGATDHPNSSMRPVLFITYTLPPPDVVLNQPTNGSEFPHRTAILLNASVSDNEAIIRQVDIYGTNGTPGKEDLIFQNISVLNNSLILYNWSAPVLRTDPSTSLLIHLDNRRAYGENDTHVYDFSGNGRNGTVHSAVANRSGKLAGAFSFHGTSNITFGDADMLIGVNRTYAFWVLPFSFTGTKAIVSKYDGANGFEIQQDNTDIVVLADSSSVTVPLGLSSTEYTHIAVSVSDENITVYVNGVRMTSNTFTSITTNNDMFTIGSRRSSLFFTGSVDELKVVNTSLTDNDIQNLAWLHPGTYTWVVNATDATPDIGRASSQFEIAIPPLLTILTPPDNTLFIGTGDITLNASVSDTSPTEVRIYGSNTTPAISDLLYASVTTFASYNWTSPVQNADPTTVLLLHADNRSEWGENDTTVRDFSGLHNNATCVVCPAFGNGKFARGLEFNGSTVMNVSNPQLLDLTGNFTIEAWIKPGENSVDLTTNHVIIAKGNTYILSHSNAANGIRMRFSGGVDCDSTSQLFAGRWYHVAASYNGSAIFVYVDGILEQICPSIIYIQNNVNVSIGSSPSGEYFNGTIDEIVIRNITLTPIDIMDHYRLRAGQYQWTVNATDAVNAISSTEVRTLNVTRYLEVQLVSPIDEKNIATFHTFVVNVSIFCRSERCGGISGSVQYNGSSLYPDTNISVGGTPFSLLSGDTNAHDCTDSWMVKNDYCNLTWIINATGSVGERATISSWIITNMTGLEANMTGNASLNIVECAIDVVPTFSSILFGTSIPGNLVNATGNTVGYNITASPDNTCPIDIYIKGTDLNLSLSPQYRIGVGNLSFSNQSLDNTSTTLSAAYQPMWFLAGNGTNITTYYWLQVPPTFAGNYQGVITYTGVKAGTTP